MIVYHFDLYPRLTPVAGALVRRLVNLQQAEYRGEANGTGSGKIILRGNSADAAFLDPKGMQYIRVVRDDGATEAVVGGFFLENGDYEALTERSTKKLTFGGAGALSYLSRAIAAEETYIAGAEGPFDDTWHWYYSPAGSILWRMVTEALDPDRPQSPIAGVTLNFTQSLDSDGNAWPGYGTSWLFTAQVKEGLVPIMRRLLEAGLYVWMDPDTFELSAWMANAHGRDRTGVAWGTNVVRFQAPTAATVATGNIKSDAKRGIGALLKRSDLLVGSAEGTEWVNDPTADLVWEGGYQVDDPTGTSLSQIGAAQLDARNDAGDTVRLRMMLDSSPTTGKYLPFEHILLDDRVTLHTGTGQWDWNETEQKVAAISLKLRTGGDWDAWVDLGSKYSSIEERAFANQPVGAHTHPPNPRLCALDPGDFIEDALDWTGLRLSYRDGGGVIQTVNAEPADWKLTGFDDSAWGAVEFEVATAGIRPVASAGNIRRDEYLLRQEFYIDTSELSGADVDLNYTIDDGGTVWVNGTEVLSVGTPYASGPLTGTVAVARSLFVEGLNCVAIQAWNQDNGTNGATPPGGTYASITIEVRTGIVASTSAQAARCGHKHNHMDLLNRDALNSHPITAITGLVDALAAATLPWFVVTAYGATGDGTTDDTAAINLAIAALNTAGAGVLYFPAGKYLCSAALTTITANCLILGDGPHAFEETTGGSIVACSSDTAVLFTITAEHARFEHLGLLNTNGGTPSAGAAVVANGPDVRSRVDFNDVHVLGFYIGADIQVGAGWVMDSCLFQGQVLYSVKIRNTINDDIGDWSIANSYFTARTQAATSAIRIESSGGGKIVNCKFNQYVVRYTHAIDLNVATAISSSVLLVSNSSFENIDGDALHVETAGAGTWGLINFSGNQVALYTNNSGKGVSLVAASAGNLADCVISSNVFLTDGTARSAIQLTNVDNVTLVGNELADNFTSLYSATTSTNITDGASPSGAAGGDLSGTYPNPSVVDDSHSHTSTTVPSGEILISDTPSTPLIFADLIQNEAQDDLVYSDL